MFDETNAQLDRLLAADRARRAADLAKLEAKVAGLSVPVGEPAPEPGPGAPPGEGRGTATRRGREGTHDADGPVTLPRRTTHGGPFGPAVREKLIREALGRR